MENHKRHIWLSIYVLFFVLVIGSSSALAAEIIGYCGDGNALGSCLEIKNSQLEVVYVVKTVKVVNGTYVDANPGDGWPTALGEFMYWAGPAAVTGDNNEYYPAYTKPSAWSYIVFNLDGEPLDADPPGAQLELTKLPSCVDEDDKSPLSVFYKLNPSVNFKGGAYFTLYAKPGTSFDPCGNNSKAYVLFGKECSGGNIALPSLDDPFVQQRNFWCTDEVYIEVMYDQCSVEPYVYITYINSIDNINRQIYYEGYTGPEPPKDPTLEVGSPVSPYFFADVPDGTYRNDQVTNWGPSFGTLLCTDSHPVFVWKDRGYFCAPLAP